MDLSPITEQRTVSPLPAPIWKVVRPRGAKDARNLGYALYLGCSYVSLLGRNSLEAGILCCRSTTISSHAEYCGSSFCTVLTNGGSLSTFEVPISSRLPSTKSSPGPLHYRILHEWIMVCNGVSDRRLVWLPQEWRSYRIADAANGRILLREEDAALSRPSCVLLDVRKPLALLTRVKGHSVSPSRDR